MCFNNKKFKLTIIKKSIFILVAFLFTQLTLAQLRKSYSEIHKLYPEATSKGLRAERSFLVEDLIVSKDEKKMIMYTKDSIAIAVGTLNNNFMDEAAFKNLIASEIPNFKVSKTATVNTMMYYYDTMNKYLVMTNPQSENNKFPIKLVMLVIDPFIIEAWTKNITNWE
mgnify:CR=1 FL=1